MSRVTTILVTPTASRLRLSDETGSALKEILEGVEATVAKISEIASATVEQSSNAKQVSEAIQGIAEVTEQAAAGSEQMPRKIARRTTRKNPPQLIL